MKADLVGTALVELYLGLTSLNCGEVVPFPLPFDEFAFESEWTVASEEEENRLSSIVEFSSISRP